MFETTSVFDVMAADDADRRVAQRRALALAHTRLESTLGRFLRAATTTEEFEARLAACQDDFALHVAEASAEVGYDSPETIVKTLTASFLRERRWQPVVAQDIGEEIDPSEMQDSNDGKGINEPHQDDEDEKAPKIKSSGVGPAPAAPGSVPPPVGPGYKSDPWGSADVDPYTCHGCGEQSVEFAQTGRCPHCGTQKGAPTHMAAAQKIAESGNTDLGGPEPKMDKRLWAPKNLGDPDIKDGRWPTVRKDATEPVGPPNNEHELSEIGEQFTETQKLPNNKGDAGFASGGEDSGPHTDTWSGKDGLATPVTRETQPE